MGNHRAMFGGRAVLALGLVVPALAGAESPGRCVDVQFTPAPNLQIVAWIAKPTGEYVDTLYITQQTGSFGLGNRPGRFDFNSGPIWPYGRRITTFPVWSHAHGLAFPQVLFQNDFSDDPDTCFTLTGNQYQQCGENNLSHAFDQSSRESHFCRPLQDGEPSWDTGTCATTAYSDKGRFSTTSFTGYPPRTDLVRSAGDSPSVDMYKAMNPFDAVSQPTPAGGELAHAPWPVPQDLPLGDYLLFVEAAQEFDFNASYDPTAFPPPTGIYWSEYGKPYRGQPSIVYRVPFSIATTDTTSTTLDYAGYGDPTGADGMLRPPDTSITADTPGTGASRLELVSDDGELHRVKVSVSENVASAVPDAPASLAPTDLTGSGIAMAFTAPGVGAEHLKVAGYEIRVRALDEMTPANFANSMPVTAKVTPEEPGHAQTFELDGLLPETDYWIGIRAFDGCHNAGAVAIAKVTTLARVSGAVDACFVATAAYGSLLANDVELLRHFRDSLLRSNAIGELGVETYYTFGPALAGVIGESDLLRTSARGFLRPLVELVRALAF